MSYLKPRTKKDEDFLKKLKWQSKIYSRAFFKTYKLNQRAKNIADAIHTLIQIEYMLKPEYRVAIQKLPHSIRFDVYRKDSIDSVYLKAVITHGRTRENICKQVAIIRRELWQRGCIAEADLRPLNWIWH